MEGFLSVGVEVIGEEVGESVVGDVEGDKEGDAVGGDVVIGGEVVDGDAGREWVEMLWVATW